jgi:hypothetical protein
MHRRKDPLDSHFSPVAFSLLPSIPAGLIFLFRPLLEAREHLNFTKMVRKRASQKRAWKRLKARRAFLMKRG